MGARWCRASRLCQFLLEVGRNAGGAGRVRVEPPFCVRSCRARAAVLGQGGHGGAGCCSPLRQVPLAGVREMARSGLLLLLLPGCWCAALAIDVHGGIIEKHFIFFYIVRDKAKFIFDKEFIFSYGMEESYFRKSFYRVDFIVFMCTVFCRTSRAFSVSQRALS